MTANAPICADLQERERTMDWLTALSPILLLAICYYRWQAVGLVLTTAAGYLAVATLLQWAGIMTCRTAPALVNGMVIAFCLPAAAPIWLSALTGAVAAPVAVLPQVLYQRWPHWPISRPLLHPALTGYLVVRLLFPMRATLFSLPSQWIGLDSTTSATPLAALGDAAVAEPPLRLLVGVHAGAVGEGCIPVIVLAALYLVLRRRMRVIAPVAMLATVSLLSWLLWGMPLYGILAGGSVLAAVLLADRDFAPMAWKSQILYGVIAGGVTVLLRQWVAMDGTAVGVLVAGLLSPLYAVALHWSGVGLRFAGRYLARFSVWFWHHALVPFFRLVAQGGVWVWEHALVPFSRFLWRNLCQLWTKMWDKFANLRKTKK